MTVITNSGSKLSNRLKTLDYIAQQATPEQIQAAIEALPLNSRVLEFLQPFLNREDRSQMTLS